jgi:hypothetical protein
MKSAIGYIFAVAATCVATLSAAPGTMDTTKRDESVSTEQKAVLPEAKAPERNDAVGDRRFDTRQVEKKDAVIGERRSNVVVGETRPKRTFVGPERKTYEVIDRKENSWSGKMSRYSTSEDAYHSRTAIRFQDKISDASPTARNAQPAVEKRTTFDRINRFVFHKNSDQKVAVTRAGSEKPAADASHASSPGTATPDAP